jgi:hypothetical protein
MAEIVHLVAILQSVVAPLEHRIILLATAGVIAAVVAGEVQVTITE